MPSTLPLLVFASFGLIVFLLVGMFRRRPAAAPNAPADGEAAPASGKRKWETLWVFLFLVVAWLVIDVLSITVLSGNARNTFEYVPQQPQQQKPVR